MYLDTSGRWWQVKLDESQGGVSKKKAALKMMIRLEHGGDGYWDIAWEWSIGYDEDGDLRGGCIDDISNAEMDTYL